MRRRNLGQVGRGSKIIALITDLGSRDYFVGAIKGSILSINRDARIVDVTHLVTKYNILEAAFTLYNAAETFPRDTVFVVVVDPGVGTKRKCVLLRTGNGMLFVAPDNGVLSMVSKRFGVDCIWEVSNSKLMRPNVSRTFHGRDIMAPVAAHLSLGVEPEEVGPELSKIMQFQMPRLTLTKTGLTGRVIGEDDFGNLVTNIDAATAFRLFRIGEDLVVSLGKKEIRLRFVWAFGEVKPGKYLCFVGSSGMLELAKNLGSLAGVLKVKIGADFKVKRAI